MTRSSCRSCNYVDSECVLKVPERLLKVLYCLLWLDSEPTEADLNYSLQNFYQVLTFLAVAIALLHSKQPMNFLAVR